jgi:periplasmic divalent cation tolerance protein
MTDVSGSKYLVVLVTVGSADEAAGLARTLVEERLAACGNLVERIRSVYRWKGKIEDEGETLLVLKTTAAQFEPLRQRIVELHSYDVPEVIALEITDGHKPYLDWIDSNTT